MTAQESRSSEFHEPRQAPARIVRTALAWGLACGPLVAMILATTHSAWAGMLVYHTGCVVLARRIGSWGACPSWRALLFVGVATASLVAGAGAALMPVVEPYVPMTRWSQWGLAPPHDSWILAYFVGVNPWVEEWFWRGGLAGPKVRSELGALAGGLTSIVAFWMFHVFVLGAAFGWLLGGIVSVFVLFAGVVWTVLRQRTNNVWWAASSHQGANLGLAVVYFTQLRADG